MHFNFWFLSQVTRRKLKIPDVAFLSASKMPFKSSISCDLPGVGPDGLVPRHPDLDTFTRPVDPANGTIRYDVRPQAVRDAS